MGICFIYRIGQELRLGNVDHTFALRNLPGDQYADGTAVTTLQQRHRRHRHGWIRRSSPSAGSHARRHWPGHDTAFSGRCMQNFPSVITHLCNEEGPRSAKSKYFSRVFTEKAHFFAKSFNQREEFFSAHSFFAKFSAQNLIRRRHRGAQVS